MSHIITVDEEGTTHEDYAAAWFCECGERGDWMHADSFRGGSTAALRVAHEDSAEHLSVV